LHSLPSNIQTPLPNNRRPHLNHSFFSQLLSPNSQQKGQLLDKIKQQWGSLHQFKKQFPDQAPAPFRSGCTW
ncbi:Fe-Mn family superoxide dismutase, partial [Staphylococcus epidermidis]|uniref:Fe-Mn family superoxide dismutase n=1 Tax=Staphylococcus epidermidis TaxID=1282 RepID=UPI001C92EF87